MIDLVDVTLNLPNGYREQLQFIADTAGVPFDHVLFVVIAMHICNGRVPLPVASEPEAKP